MIACFRGHADQPSALAFTEDSKLLLSISLSESSLRIWDVTSGKGVAEIDVRNPQSLAVHTAPDRQLIAIGLTMGTIQLRDLSTGSLVRTILVAGRICTDVVFSPNGRLLAAIWFDEPPPSNEESVRQFPSVVSLFDVDTGAELNRLPIGFRNGVKMRLSNDGDTLVLVDRSGDSLDLWIRDDHDGILRYRPIRARILDASFNVHNQLVTVELNELNQVHVVHPKGERSPLQLKTDIATPPSNAIVTSAASVIALQYGSDFRVWRGKDCAEAWRLSPTSNFDACALSADGKLLAVAHDNGRIEIWDSSPKLPSYTPQLRDVQINCRILTPDGRELVAGYADGTVKAWNIETVDGSLIARHSGAVLSITLCGSPPYLVTASADGSVFVWNWATRKKFGTVQSEGEIEFARVSPCGRWVACQNRHGLLSICALHDTGHVTFTKLASVYAQEDMNVAFSPDGVNVVILDVKSIGKSAIVWEIESGRNRFELKGHDDFIQRMAYSPDNSLIATASYDSTVRLWSAATGGSLRVLEGDNGGYSSIAFTSNSKQLVAACGSTCHIWDVDTGSCIERIHGSAIADEVVEAKRVLGMYGVELNGETQIRTWNGELIAMFPAAFGQRHRLWAQNMWAGNSGGTESLDIFQLREG